MAENSPSTTPPTRRVWNDGTGSVFREAIPDDEDTVQITDPRYLGEYRGPGYQSQGWINVPLNEDEWM